MTQWNQTLLSLSLLLTGGEENIGSIIGKRRYFSDMGAFLDKPNTEKRSASGSFKDLRYGLSSMQGWRREMEDAHCAVTQLPGLKDWSFFAVFDGHAGSRVSAVCSKDLVSEITKQTPSQDTGEQVAAENIKLAIKKGFLALDDRMRELPEVVSGEDKSGSTAVCVMISPTHVFFANCGDSRGLLCRKGKVKFATLDHKPMNSDEKKRIQSAGGIVMTQRVNGSLAVSRALGDFDYKNVEGKGQCEQLVSPEPEIEEIARKPDDEFVILACDGVYDVMSNDDLCAFVRNRMQISDDLEKICSQVVDTCLYKVSHSFYTIR